MRTVTLPVSISARLENDETFTLEIHGTGGECFRAGGFPDLFTAWQALACVPERLELALVGPGRHRAGSR